MGREATITYEQVPGAAEALHLAGVKPTSRAIRERLGNTAAGGRSSSCCRSGASRRSGTRRTR